MALISFTELLGAALVFALYRALYVLIVIALPGNAITARLASILPLSAAAYAVRCYVVTVVGPPVRQSVLLIMTIADCLLLTQYIIFMRLDSAQLSELASKGSTATKSPRHGRVGIGKQIWQAISLASNPRGIGTQWEVKNVEHRPYKQTRIQFLSDTVSKMALSYLVLDVMMNSSAPSAHLVTQEKQTFWRLWTLTAEDIKFRALSFMLFGLSSRCLLYLWVHLLALLSVGLGLSSPDFWPPMFGPIQESYTIRKFWRKYWHQGLHNTLTGYVKFACDKILCIPRGTYLSGYTHLFLVFVMSGLIHHPSDVMQGLSPHQTASLGFFLLQPLGIMAEDAVQMLTESWPIPRVMRKIVGFTWVSFFLFATIPTWMFPITRLESTGSLLPFSVVAPLEKYVAVVTGK